jgi:hypothetical protein
VKAAVTVTVQLLERDEFEVEVAVIVTVPAATPVTRPEVETVA